MAAFAQYESGLGVFCRASAPMDLPAFRPPPGLAGYSQPPFPQPTQPYHDPNAILGASRGFNQCYEKCPLDVPGSHQSDLASLVAAVVTEVIGSEKPGYAAQTNKSLDQNISGYTYTANENWSPKASTKNNIARITSKFPVPDVSCTADVADAATDGTDSTQCGDCETGSGGADTQLFRNPGSVGHPDFCSRSCHYFAGGTCSKGDSCQFCHMSHRKRPMRLDKANRSQLRNMSFEERASLILPIMRKKAQAFGLSMEPLAHLEQCIASEYPIDQLALEKMRTKPNHKVFRDVLKVGNMNSFVKLLADADLSPAITDALDMACAVWKSKCSSLEEEAQWDL